MNRECLCDNSSEFTEEKNFEEDDEHCLPNRIFLNFTRDFRHPAKDSFNVVKVKELFKLLSEREDLQEMKVSGWSEQEETEVEGEEEEIDAYTDDRTTPRNGGQRFAMSRDFWYRKLNTLKAQKLDEVALEAKDLPPDDRDQEPKCMKWVTTEKVFSSQIPEKKDQILEEINLFEKSIAKPMEKQLKKKFINVYDNRKYFTKNCN